MAAKSLKSQVTMLMIVGLTLFIIVSLVLYLSKSTIKKQSQQGIKQTQETAIEIQPVKEFVAKCLDKLAKDAIVYWRPRKNLRDSFIMFYRFAFGDAESGVIRPKVFLVFLRYFTGLVLVTFYLLTSQSIFLLIIFLFLTSYLIWAAMKNFRYVKHPLAYLYLPILQFTSDLAVLIGTSLGLVKRLGNK